MGECPNSRICPTSLLHIGFKEFKEYKGIIHRYSRVRQSNDQAHIERFNRTLQEECLNRTLQTVPHFRRALKKWLPYYNGERMHMGLNYKTPAEMLKAVPSS